MLMEILIAFAIEISGVFSHEKISVVWVLRFVPATANSLNPDFWFETLALSFHPDKFP